MQIYRLLLFLRIVKIKTENDVDVNLIPLQLFSRLHLLPVEISDFFNNLFMELSVP